MRLLWLLISIALAIAACWISLGLVSIIYFYPSLYILFPEAANEGRFDLITPAIILGVALILWYATYKSFQLFEDHGDRGYPKTEKYIAVSLGILAVSAVLFFFFEDQLFTKTNAKELVEQQGLQLRDDFELVSNRSMSAIGESYHTFTLRISESDKMNAIAAIKSAPDFTKSSPELSHNGDYVIGARPTQNYQTATHFVREILNPAVNRGTRRSFWRVSISEGDPELTYEYIDE